MLKTYATLQSQYSIIKTLNQDWLAYNKSYGAYLPLTTNDVATKRILHQWIDLSIYSQHTLVLNLAPTTTFFINKLLIARNIGDSASQQSYPISELVAQYGNKIFVSLYSPSQPVFFSTIQITSVVAKHLGHDPIIPIMASQVNPKIRAKLPNNHHSTLIFLIAISLITLIKNSETELASSFFGFKNILSNNLLEDAQLLQITKIPILILIYLTALLLAYLAQYSLSAQSIFFSIQYFPLLSSTNPFNNIMRMSVLLSFVFLVRYAALLILSWFFRQEYVVKIHFFDNIKLLLKFLMILSLAYFVADLTHFFSYEYLATLLRISLILTLLILLIKNLYISTKITHSRNVYLFSYLCISELLPTIFLITFLIK